MNIAAAIEKNRKVLLRWVTCWLLAAIAYRCARTHLPPHLSRFVNAVLCKCEAAIGHLLLAAHHMGAASASSEPPIAGEAYFFKMAARSLADPHFFEVGGQLSMADIVKRLKAMRRVLRRMARPKAKSTVTAKHRAASYLAESTKRKCPTFERKARRHVDALGNYFVHIVLTFLYQPIREVRAPP